jgi:hypothetical protein
MPTFFPPIAYDNPAILPDTQGIKRELFKYYGPYPRGRSVVLVSGHWTVMDYPLNEVYVQGQDGIDFFLGGHQYQVSASIAAALTADGFGGYLS